MQLFFTEISVLTPSVSPQGLYDNFLSMKVKESSFGTVVSALDWLGFTDIVNTMIMHGQNFQLMRYLPFLPVAFHLFFAASNIPRIAYPNSHYEVGPGVSFIRLMN